MEKKISYPTVVAIIFTVVFLLLLLTFHGVEETPTEYSSKIAKISDTRYWYYEIYKNNQLIIKQKHIPGVQGIQGFVTKEEAWKVAEIVVKKLENGDFPHVSEEELEELSITFKNH